MSVALVIADTTLIDLVLALLDLDLLPTDYIPSHLNPSRANLRLPACYFAPQSNSNQAPLAC